MPSPVYFPGAVSSASADGDKPSVLALTQPSTGLWVLAFTGGETPDNRLTPHLLRAYLEALDHVEKEWDALASDEERAAKGAALVTTGQVAPGSKYFSNGLDLAKAMSTPGFFDHPFTAVFRRLLTFPIPTIAAIGGHAFAGAVSLAMAHDYRVMNGRRGYLCMNEIFFGAPIPAGMSAVVRAKVHDGQVLRALFLEGHRFSGPEAHAKGLVDFVVPGADHPPIPADKAKDVDAALPQHVLDAAMKVASKVRPLAAKGAWGINKAVSYVDALEQMQVKYVLPWLQSHTLEVPSADTVPDRMTLLPGLLRSLRARRRPNCRMAMQLVFPLVDLDAG